MTQALAPAEQKVLDDIRYHGCQVMHVFHDNADLPDFSYSIGFLAEVYQIVWPGAVQGLFPWEKGCDQFVIASQPALYETRH